MFSTLEGVSCRCRPDLMKPFEDGIIIGDLKSTTNAAPGPDGFGKSVANFGYDWQDAFYTDVCTAAELQVMAFVFIAVESSPPYLVSTSVITDEAREHGREQYRQALGTYKRCVESGNWPGYSEAIEMLALPSWYNFKRRNK